MSSHRHQSRETFENFLREFAKTSHREFFTKVQYDSKIIEIENLKNNARKKSPIDYHTLSRYDTIFVRNELRLIVKRKHEDDPLIYFAHSGQIFDIIKKAHEEIHHAGIKRTDIKLRRSYKNIHRELVDFYIQNCTDCQEKNKKYTKQIYLSNKHLLNYDLFDKGYFSLIDMESSADGEFRYVMYYQDQATKFAWLRAIRTQAPNECAQRLFDIFVEFNPPVVLYSDRVREFVADVVNEIKLLWPDLKLVHGASRNLNINEKLNEEIKCLITKWMLENEKKNWTHGIKFVQRSLNTVHHTDLRQTPHKTMFGAEAKQGLKNFYLNPYDSLSRVSTEEELLEILRTDGVLLSDDDENFCD